ncbi:MAG: hypothetical protein GY858_02725 [Candidatus Omnitrophica bacterium]|nr:hypothetical protein [Candidatus Omnitrophota bacterium]
MFIIGIIGVVALIFAVFFIFFPNFIAYLDAMGREVVIDISATLQSHRLATGIFYFVAGIFMIYVGFFYR